MGVITKYDNCLDQDFSRLVEEYQTKLHRMCYAILRDEELAKDAVQDTFFKVYKALDIYRGECNEKTWIMRIAINTCRDIRRSAWFRRVDRRITPEDILEKGSCIDSEKVELSLTILQLPKDLKEVTLLYYYQDMTMRETAKALGVSLSTVSKRLSRAQKKLYVLLEGRDLYE